MNEEETGVVTSEEELETPEEGSEGESEEVITPEEGEKTPAIGDDSAKRINDLMSMWQKAEARALKLEQELKGQNETSKAKSRFEDPNYKPDNYNQYYQDIRAAIQEEQEAERKAAEEKQNEIKTQVDGFMAEVKGKDKNFDEKDFSDYALRHNFNLNTINDLKSVYSAYKDLQETGTNKVIKKDNISKPSGVGGNNTNFTDIRARGGSILDGALEAFNRLKS